MSSPGGFEFWSGRLPGDSFTAVQHRDAQGRSAFQLRLLTKTVSRVLTARELLGIANRADCGLSVKLQAYSYHKWQVRWKGERGNVNCGNANGGNANCGNANCEIKEIRNSQSAFRNFH
jgi:hypothetical protein